MTTSPPSPPQCRHGVARWSASAGRYPPCSACRVEVYKSAAAKEKALREEAEAACAGMKQFFIEIRDSIPHPSVCDQIHAACNKALAPGHGAALLKLLAEETKRANAWRTAWAEAMGEARYESEHPEGMAEKIKALKLRLASAERVVEAAKEWASSSPSCQRNIPDPENAIAHLEYEQEVEAEEALVAALDLYDTAIAAHDSGGQDARP